MRTWAVLSLACAAWAAASVGGAPAAETPQYLDYLYIEPNTGGSSGGHAAICLGEACYHFQQIDGSIRLHRESAERVDFDYRVLGNRTVHVSRVVVTAETRARIGAAFDRRLRVQERHFEVLAERKSDRELLERLLGRRETNPVRLPGSGYFVRDQSEAPAAWWGEDGPPAEPIARLARHIGALHGDDFLERRAAELRASLNALEPSSGGDEACAPRLHTLAPVERGFSARHREIATGLLAVEVLRAAPALLPERLLRLDSELRLTPAEGEALRRHGERLEAALVRLVTSARPDWGYPLLIGMARLLAIDESLRCGTLVVLDGFADDAPTIPAAQVAAHAGTLALVREERHADLIRLRRAFFAAQEADEARLTMLELAANLFAEVERGVAEHAPIRLPAGAPLPSRSALRYDWPLPALSGAALDDALAGARRREDSYRKALQRLYAYDLLERNCVTELFRTIETALAAGGSEADRRTRAAASRRDLGGYVDWSGDLNFIPLLSQRSVRAEYRLAETEEKPSCRLSALRRMYERENDLRVALRESNVLTARTYEHNEDDPLFLFFTDDVLLRRPLYGAVNLAVGLGGALVGVVLLPLDGGTTLRAGLDGALFSLPELGMINLRKGSLAFAPRQWARGCPSDIDPRYNIGLGSG